MNPITVASALLLAAGGFFFIAGTVGLLRFPDVYTRLHALTKIDNLGLGLMVLGLMLQAESVGAVIELALIWLLALAASGVMAHLVAGSTSRHGVTPWRR